MGSTLHAMYFHIVFSTKNRRPTLNPAHFEDLWSYMGGICRRLRCHLLSAGGVEDHVHLLVRGHPTTAVSDLLKNVKGGSSHWINAKKRADTKFAWQRGYGVFSVSQSGLEAVSGYVENQAERHRQLAYRKELNRLLELHEMEFDPEQHLE